MTRVVPLAGAGLGLVETIYLCKGFYLGMCSRRLLLQYYGEQCVSPVLCFFITIVLLEFSSLSLSMWGFYLSSYLLELGSRG